MIIHSKKEAMRLARKLAKKLGRPWKPCVEKFEYASAKTQYQPRTIYVNGKHEFLIRWLNNNHYALTIYRPGHTICVSSKSISELKKKASERVFHEYCEIVELTKEAAFAFGV